MNPFRILGLAGLVSLAMGLAGVGLAVWLAGSLL